MNAHGKHAAQARRDASGLLGRIEGALQGRDAGLEPVAEPDALDIETVMAEIARAMANPKVRAQPRE